MIYRIFSKAEIKKLLNKNLIYVATIFAAAVMSLTGCTKSITADFMFEMGTQAAQKKKYPKAAEWYQKAADTGNASAMLNLGVFYEQGLGLVQDYAKAREWFEKAAAVSNSGLAFYNLGVLYDQGWGVGQDYTKAREYYEKAASAGETNAMSNLGVLYQNGQGGTQDYAKAREWFEKAAAGGGLVAGF